MNPFQIPNLPTDNLYKFKALAGIVLILFSFTTMIFLGTGLNSEVNELTISIKIDSAKISYLKKDVENYKYKSKELDSILSQYESLTNNILDKSKEFEEEISLMQNDPEWRDYLEFVFNYIEFIDPGYIQKKELVLLRSNLLESARELSIKIAEKSAKSKIHKTKLSNLKEVICFCLFNIVFGFIYSFVGFRNWKLKIQDPMDEKIQIELRLLKFKELGLVQEHE